MDWIQRLNQAVVEGRKNEIFALANEAVGDGMSALRLVNEAMVPAMNTVSVLWLKEEYFIPEVMRSAKTMQIGMDALRPHLINDDIGKGIKVAIGTVKGDLHDIGKNLVATMFESVGYEVENLGVDLAPDRFVEAAQSGARVIGLSSLLTTSMPEMKNVIELLQANGIRDRVTLLVGGAPVTSGFAVKIGADYYAEGPVKAIRILNSVFG
jgi:5-methyltetrahydrofolate--homocysteine methyltransferase